MVFGDRGAARGIVKRLALLLALCSGCGDKPPPASTPAAADAPLPGKSPEQAFEDRRAAWLAADGRAIWNTLSAPT